MDVEKLLEIGTQLGLSGSELRAWIDTQRAEQRAERAAERERLKEAAEREREERREADERAREAAERAKEAAEREKEAAERAKEAAENEIRILELKIRLQEGSRNTASATADSETSPNVSVMNPQKLLPLFDERRDDLHAYLQRFERVAAGQGWAQDKWAVALSMCLTGEALTVIGRMTAEESLDYSKVKKALLQRFKFTAQGYQEKFRKARAEDGETGKQFAARLSSYFDHWVEMTNISKTYEGLRDLVLSEQFYSCCHPKLVVFLKERECVTLNALADVTDRFLEAQNLANLGKVPADVRDDPKGATDTQKRTPQKCFLCDRPGHRAQNCPTVARGNTTCSQCGRSGHSADNCRGGSGGKDTVAACVIYEPPRRFAKTKSYKAESSDARASGPNSKDVSDRNSPFLVKGLPVVPGRVLGKAARVLRDTGSNTAIVRRDLVDDDCFTGKTRRVVLLDGTAKELPEAKIQVQTPYFVGEISAACMACPLYDLVLGNIPGVREPHDPDLEWEYGVIGDSETGTSSLGRTLPSEPHYLFSAVASAEALQDIRLRAPLLRQPNLNRVKLAQEQHEDPTLRSIYRKVGKESRSARGHHYTFLESEDLLYRVCRLSNGNEFKQIVMPQTFRESVLRAAHERLMPRHAGIRKTTYRILEEFYWPDLGRDVKRFVRSCNVCNRKTPEPQVAAAFLLNAPNAATCDNPGGDASRHDTQSRLRHLDTQPCFWWHTPCTYQRSRRHKVSRK